MRITCLQMDTPLGKTEENFRTAERMVRGAPKCDVLVLPDGAPKNYKKRYVRESAHYIKRFQDRGGIVIAFGEGTKYLPVHKNSRTVETWQELKPAIIKCFE